MIYIVGIGLGLIAGILLVSLPSIKSNLDLLKLILTELQTIRACLLRSEDCLWRIEKDRRLSTYDKIKQAREKIGVDK